MLSVVPFSPEDRMWLWRVALSAGGLQPESSHRLILPRSLALLATGLMSSVLRDPCSLLGRLAH